METTLTFEIGGRVEMRDLREGIALFTDLIFGLSPNRGVSWVVEDLRAGGAKVALRGESEDPAVLERIVAEYEKIGLELSQNQDPSHVDVGARSASRDILELADRVDYIKIGTPNQDRLIRRDGKRECAHPPYHSTSIGAITGTAQTLTDRDGLTLIVRDDVLKKPVECEFEPGHEEAIREAWGKRVTVCGLVERDWNTGVPRFIRGAWKVEILPEVAPGAYKNARGAIPWKPGDMRAEEVIRKMRDDV